MKPPSLPSRLRKRGVLDIKKNITKSKLENTVASFPLVRKEKDSATSSSSDKSLGENADEKSSTTKSSDGKSKSSSSEKSSDEKSGAESKPSTAKLTAGDAGGKPSGSSSTDSKSSSDGKISDTDRKSADSKSSAEGKSSDSKLSSDNKFSSDGKTSDSKSSGSKSTPNENLSPEGKISSGNSTTDNKSSEKDSSTVGKPSSGKSSTDSKLSTDGKFSDNTSTSGGKFSSDGKSSVSDGKSSVSNGNSADSKSTSGGKLSDTKSVSDGKLGSNGKSNTGTPESDVKTPQLSASSPALFATIPDLPSPKSDDTLVVTVPASSSLDSPFTSGKQEFQPIETQLSPQQPSEEPIGGEASLQTDGPSPIPGDVPQPDLSNPAPLPEDGSKSKPVDPPINKQPSTEKPNPNDDGGLDAISLGNDSAENVNGSTVITAHAQPDGTNVTRVLIITFSIVAGLICFALIIYIIRMRLRHRRVGRAESPPPSPRLGYLDAPQLPPTMDLGQPRFGNATPDSFYRVDEERLRQEDMKLNYGIVV